MSCGVPQGSILGPLLFLCYINDIYKCSTIIKFILFADDTTLLFSAKSLDALFATVNKELILISDWFKANKLSLNTNKTNLIIFRSKIPNNAESQIKFDNSPIANVTCAKFLRVEIDSELNWKKHISTIQKKYSA